MSTPKVTVLGSINMDLTTTTARLPRAGETVLGDTFQISQGGKGANQAIASARSGAKTTFLGAVGDDEFADQLVSTVRYAGVNVDAIRRTTGASGVAAITVDSHGENSIVVVAGANTQLRELTEDELTLITDADIMLCQLEIPIDTVIEAAAHGRAHGTLVMLNPSPVQDLPDALIEAVDILVVNEAEAEAVGADVMTRIDHVVTTRGASGALYRGPERSVAVPTPTVNAVDTTGAGDAFAGALAAKWMRGPEEAVRYACAAGACAATRRGAGSSSGTTADIEALLA